MELTKEERQFLVRRTRCVNAWRYAGTILLVAMIGLGIWFFLSKPLLANPFVMLARLKNNSIPSSTMTLMTGLLPVVVLTSIFLAITIVLFAFAAFSNERKYLTIIQKMTTVVPNELGQGESVPTDSAQQGHPADRQ